MPRLRTFLVRLLARTLLMLCAFSVVYLLLLVFPQPLFAYELEHAGITLHATTPIPDSMRPVLERVRQRLDRSPLAESTRGLHVFVCQPRWLFALFARQNYRVGGVADWLVGQHVFLRESDLVNDRLIGPSGQPVAADRPLSYFIAHELMHIAHVRHLGRLRYGRMPQWVDDGYADYVARDIDLAEALDKLKAGARELDPLRSGLYLRYQLMVAYLLDRRGVPLEDLLVHPPARANVERDLLQLPRW